MNAFYFTQRTTARFFAVVAMFSLVGGMMPTAAFADNEGEHHHPQTQKLTICHSGNGNSFNEIEISVSATGPEEGHANHQSDVIPAYTIGDFSYPGQNWDEAGQALFNNHCVPVTPEPAMVKVQLCKYDVSKPQGQGYEPIAGWGMTLSAGDDTRSLSTGENGCVTTEVAEGTGPWTAIEADPEGWQQDDVYAGQGTTFKLALPNIAENMQPWACRLTINPDAVEQDGAAIAHRCDFYNAPIVDVCPNILDVQATVPEGKEIVDGQCVDVQTELCLNDAATNYNEPAPCVFDNDPTPTCKVEIVSDATDFVVEKNASAQPLSFIHAAWTSALSGATWIWGDNPVTNPSVSETQTFQKKFGFVGTVSNATLELASDNGHSAVVNSNAAHVGGSTFGAPASYDVTSEIAQGNNELDIAVTNTAVEGSSVTDNPAGLKYKLTITGTPTSDADCSVPYNNGGGDNTDSTTYHIQGFVWNDDNINQTWDGKNTEEQGDEEGVLAGWTVRITDGEQTFSTTTDAEGKYYFDVPAGTWTITENTQSDWVRTTQESYVVTVPGAEIMTFLDSVVNAIIPTAYAAPLARVYGDYNFGNDYQPGGGGGSVRHSGGGGGSSSDPDGEVLGISDAKPQGEVLGAQVSAIPTGAPNAGAGGAAPFTFGFDAAAPVAFLRRTRVHG